jgi:hypothetical protein
MGPVPGYPPTPKPIAARQRAKAYRASVQARALQEATRIQDRTERAQAIARARRCDLPYVVDTSTPYQWSDTADPEDWPVFKAVAKILERSVYKGSADAMKDSYERVTAALKRGEGWRYYPSKWVRFRGHVVDADEALPR